MDGYTSVRLMRESGIKIPVYALTAHAMKGAEEECLQAGYSGYMPKPIDIDLLLNHLAKELGGSAEENKQDSKMLPLSTDEGSSDSTKDNLVPILSPEINNSVEPVAEPQASRLPIRSALSDGTNKFQKLIDKFIVRLNQKQQEIHAVIEVEDYSELEDLAHWLKGSAGSIGFHDFTEPAAELEKAARLKDHHSIVEIMTGIDALIDAITVEPEKELTHTEEKDMDKSKPNPEKDTEINVITSSLLQSSPTLKPMVERFILRLSDKITQMETALKNMQFGELTDLAHWLKGSAGSLGFHDFTLPATELEGAAKTNHEENSQYWLEVIKELSSKIDISG